MDIKPLLDLACAKVASMIKGASIATRPRSFRVAAAGGFNRTPARPPLHRVPQLGSLSLLPSLSFPLWAPRCRREDAGGDPQDL